MKLKENELLILSKLFDGTELQLNSTYTPTLDAGDIKAKYRELVFYLNNLKRYDLIDIDIVEDKNGKETKYYCSGGSINPIYKNAAISVPFWERIHINKNGISIVEQLRMTKFDKVKRFFKNQLVKLGEKISENLLSSLAIFLVGILVGNVGNIAKFVCNLFK